MANKTYDGAEILNKSPQPELEILQESAYTGAARVFSALGAQNTEGKPTSDLPNTVYTDDD